MKLNIVLLCFGFTLLTTFIEARGNSKSLAGRRKKTKGRLADGVAEENENKIMETAIDEIENTKPSVEIDLDTDIKNKKSKNFNRRKGGTPKHGKKQRRRKSKKDKNGSRALEEDQKEKLRLTMREMFGFDHMTTPRAATQLSMGNPQTTLAPPMMDILDRGDDMDRGVNYPQLPKFMLQLYRTYSEDSSLVLLNSMSRGNTIRSFFSVAGHPTNLRNQAKSMLIEPITLNENMSENQLNTHERLPNIAVYTYNVSTIPLAEKVVSAELRIDQKDVDQPNTNWTVLAGVYIRARGPNNESLNLFQLVGDLTKISTTTSSAWTDVTLSKLVSLARQSDHVLVVKFSKQIQLNRFRRSIFPKPNSLNLPASFKILKTNRARRNSGKNHNNRATGYTFEEEIAAQFGVPILVVYCNDTTAAVPTPTRPLQNGVWESMDNRTSLRSTGSKRLRRSAKRNRPENGSALPSTDQPDNEISDSDRPSKASTMENDQTELYDNGESNRRVMQSLTTSKQKKNKRQRKRKCKKRGRNRKSKKCKKDKSKNRRKNLSESLNRADKVCSRKSLRVDFADLGWAGWIISPQQFDAYYCSGVCELETIREHSPSNHAVIQSVIKEFDLNDEIPSPCCVPDKMMSLSVLFLDKDESVVLKLYPGMSVESCACR